jgi:hypothetical protein
MRIEIPEIVTVYAATVRVGDIVRVGAVDHRVRDMRASHGGGKLLLFGGSGSVTLGAGVSLRAYRRSMVTIA